MSGELLRKCTQCGLEAHSEEELNLFRKSVGRHRHGRLNFCKECYNSFRRKGGKYYERVEAYKKQYKLANKEQIRAYNFIRNKKRIRFKDEAILFTENPRTNICADCGKRYPEELNTQTCMHHVIYSSDDPLKFTVELCHSCHAKLHNELKRLSDSGVEA